MAHPQLATSPPLPSIPFDYSLPDVRIRRFVLPDDDQLFPRVLPRRHRVSSSVVFLFCCILSPGWGLGDEIQGTEGGGGEVGALFLE